MTGKNSDADWAQWTQKHIGQQKRSEIIRIISDARIPSENVQQQVHPDALETENPNSTTRLSHMPMEESAAGTGCVLQT